MGEAIAEGFAFEQFGDGVVDIVLLANVMED